MGINYHKNILVEDSDLAYIVNNKVTDDLFMTWLCKEPGHQQK